MSDARLWAPWRIEYIKGEQRDECIFCAKPTRGDDAATYILRRGERCFAMLNAFPYTNGHVMVAPYEHRPSLGDLAEPVALELVRLTQETLAALRDALRPDGFNMGINEGKIAGAGFADHVHMHIVPRWAGDTNYMPVIASARVLPQSLQDSYRDLHAAFERG